jgi:putative membrane protein
MKPFVIRWLCTTLAVAVAAWMTGISYSGVWTLFVVALLLGFVNAFVRPVLMLLGLPFIVVTLGFAILILNALLFWMVSGLVPGFQVGGFWQAFFAALIVSIVNWALSLFFKTSDGQYHLITYHGGEKPVAGRVIEIDTEQRR